MNYSIFRQETYDKEAHFNCNQELELEYSMSLSDGKVYKDLQADMTVPWKMARVGVYLHTYNKTLDKVVSIFTTIV